VVLYRRGRRRSSTPPRRPVGQPFRRPSWLVGAGEGFSAPAPIQLTAATVWAGALEDWAKMPLFGETREAGTLGPSRDARADRDGGAGGLLRCLNVSRLPTFRRNLLVA